MSESDITADAAESLGLNEITVIAIFGIIIVGIITRFITMQTCSALTFLYYYGNTNYTNLRVTSS